MHSKEKPYRCTFLIPPGKEDDRGEFGFKRKASEPAEGVENSEGGMRECGARFSTSQHLKRHVESHLKTFPYIVSSSELIASELYD
jgi:general transcription factor IIIA